MFLFLLNHFHSDIFAFLPVYRTSKTQKYNSQKAYVLPFVNVELNYKKTYPDVLVISGPSNANGASLSTSQDSLYVFVNT